MLTSTDKLIEQLRHACSVALGDLLAHGMPLDVSTGRLLQASIVAAEKYRAQAADGESGPAVTLGLRAQIIKQYLDACFCDDVGQDPECEACRRVRGILDLIDMPREHLKATMTALQWMARFDHVQPKRVGRSSDICWMHVFAWNVGEPGETPHYFLMERTSGEVRTIKNLSPEECAWAKMDPSSFWDHSAAEKLSC